MESRYDFMKESEVQDIDGDLYPDVLSVDYSKVEFKELPPVVTITSADINRFWYFMYKNYGISYNDDLLLNLNGIPYVGMLEPNDKLVMISLNDLKRNVVNKSDYMRIC